MNTGNTDLHGFLYFIIEDNTLIFSFITIFKSVSIRYTCVHPCPIRSYISKESRSCGMKMRPEKVSAASSMIVCSCPA